jgi:putative DNA primase/helicase
LADAIVGEQKYVAGSEHPEVNVCEGEWFAQDAGGKLYRYCGGVYRRRAEEFVRARVKQLCLEMELTEKWGSHLANEVVEFIRVDAAELDERPNPRFVNVSNGRLHVLDGADKPRVSKLEPHGPIHRTSVQLPVSFDPAAKCPAIEKFVSQVFPADAIDLAWEVPAWLMLSDCSIQKAVLLTGVGANGKSTWLNLLTAFLGKPNTSAVSLHKLEKDQFAAARLIGRLANICPDLPSEHLAGTSVFKAITGGDVMTAEYKFRGSFDFVPFCKLLFSANHPPRSADSSDAFFRRWLVVPFDQTFEPHEQIPRKKLDWGLTRPEELSGLLNKAIEALPRLTDQGGFSEPESVKAAWRDFHATTDPLSVWLDQYTVDDPDAFVSKDALRATYNAATARDGRPGLGKTPFGRAIRKLRPTVGDAQRTIGGRVQWCYTSIGLTQPVTNESRETSGNESQSLFN